MRAVVGGPFRFFTMSDVVVRMQPPVDSYLTRLFQRQRSLTLTTFEVPSDLEIEVSLHELRPEALDPGWQDVVEVSIMAGATTAVDKQLPLGLTEGQDYRFRYAIAHGDDAARRSYRIDLWPQAPAPVEVIRRESLAGRDEHLSWSLVALKVEFTGRRGEERELVFEYADRAFAQFPELVDDLLSEAPRHLAVLVDNGENLMNRARLHEVPVAEFEHARRELNERLASYLRERAHMVSIR